MWPIIMKKKNKQISKMWPLNNNNKKKLLNVVIN